MGLHTSQKEQTDKLKLKAPDMPRGILVIRLVVASIIFAVASVAKMPQIVRVILLVISTLVAGYDIILEAVNSVEEQDYFSVPVVLVFVSVIAFAIGYGTEAAATVILYRVALIVADYVRERTILSAEELLRYRSEDEISRTVETVNRPGAGDSETQAAIGNAASFVFKILIGFAVLFAIIVPLTTHLTFRESIHRALCIILIATPLTVVFAVPLAGLVSIFSASRFGLLFNSVRPIEKLGDIRTLILDKTGVLTEDTPKLLSVQPEVIDAQTFITFAAHAVYYSEQQVAKVFANATDGEYKLDIITDFIELPGYGVEVDIGGAHVVFAARELFESRGVELPFENESAGTRIYYMTIQGRYVGKTVISDSSIDSADNIVTDLRNCGVDNSYLISESSQEEAETVAAAYGFDKAFGGLDVENKLNLINAICEKTPASNLYVYSTGIESHSRADIDIRVSKAGKYADALSSPNSIGMLPMVYKVLERYREITMENAIFAVAIKALLVFLSINGWCNLWFAMFLDCAAMIATQLNTIRVSSESLIKTLLARRAAERVEEEEEEY